MFCLIISRRQQFLSMWDLKSSICTVMLQVEEQSVCFKLIFY